MGLESLDPESSPEWLFWPLLASDLLPGFWVLPKDPDELELLLTAGPLRRGETGDPRSGNSFASGLFLSMTREELRRLERESPPPPKCDILDEPVDGLSDSGSDLSPDGS